ncbi:MAG TPA: hypothetical protein VNL15_07780, partial [Dehalococcoidia bacterium]|nr:hypothetical protein [Dehalococcoidia bacterium]
MLAESFDAPAQFFNYETIKFSSWLEILDNRRGVARFIRHQRIRFLEHAVPIFMDRVWGDGILFAGYQARSMRLLDAIPTRKGYIVLLAFPRQFSKGEVFDVVTTRKTIGGFYAPRGYWELAMSAPTETITLNVSAPAGLRLHTPEIIGPAKGDFDVSQRRRKLALRIAKPA